MKNIHSKQFLEKHMPKEKIAKLLSTQFSHLFTPEIIMDWLQSIKYCRDYDGVYFDVEGDMLVKDMNLKFFIIFENKNDDLLGFNWLNNTYYNTQQILKNKFEDSIGLYCLYVRILEDCEFANEEYYVKHVKEREGYVNGIARVVDVGLGKQDEYSQKMISVMYPFYDEIHTASFLKEMFSKERAATYLKIELELEESVEEIVERIQSIEYSQNYYNVPIDVILKIKFDEVEEHLFIFDNQSNEQHEETISYIAGGYAMEINRLVDHHVHLYYIRECITTREDMRGPLVPINLSYEDFEKLLNMDESIELERCENVSTMLIDLRPYDPTEEMEEGSINYVRHLFKDLLEENTSYTLS